MRMALTGLYRARWTDRIHEEWIRNLLLDRPDLTAEQLAWTRQRMDLAVPDCLVDGYQGLEATLELPDSDDRHVLAAAIMCHAGTIVTYNVKDFPKELLAPHGISAQHPDEFIEHAFSLNPAAVCAAVREQRAALKKPPRSVDELLDSFLRLGMASTVSVLRDNAELL